MRPYCSADAELTRDNHPLLLDTSLATLFPVPLQPLAVITAAALTTYISIEYATSCNINV